MAALGGREEQAEQTPPKAPQEKGRETMSMRPSKHATMPNQHRLLHNMCSDRSVDRREKWLSTEALRSPGVRGSTSTLAVLSVRTKQTGGKTPKAPTDGSSPTSRWRGLVGLTDEKVRSVRRHTERTPGDLPWLPAQRKRIGLITCEKPEGFG